MDFNRTSRKDDLVALFQLMVYMLNGDCYLGTTEDSDFKNVDYDDFESLKTYFEFIKSYKSKHSLTGMVGLLQEQHRKSKVAVPLFEKLKKVAQIIENLKFDEKPSYTELKLIFS